MVLIKKKLRKLVLKIYQRRQDAPKFFDICTVGYMLNKKLIKQKNNIFDLNYIKIQKQEL